MNIDLSIIDTTPGANHWAAPNKPVNNYLHWYGRMLRIDRGAGQYHSIILMRWKKRNIKPDIIGPYAGILKDAIVKKLQSANSK